MRENLIATYDSVHENLLTDTCLGLQSSDWEKNLCTAERTPSREDFLASCWLGVSKSAPRHTKKALARHSQRGPRSGYKTSPPAPFLCHFPDQTILIYVLIKFLSIHYLTSNFYVLERASSFSSIQSLLPVVRSICSYDQNGTRWS
jgi:hypothetical protein